MPDPVSLPEDVLMQMLMDRLLADQPDASSPFEVIDGVNLFVAPRASASTAGRLLCAARTYGSKLFFHSTGLGRDCRDPELSLWRLLSDLRRQLDFHDPVPVDLAGMREALPNWLARAAAGGGIAIVIQDAQDLSRDGLTADFEWLPGWLPPGIAVLISAPPGPAAEQFRDRASAVFSCSAGDADRDWELSEDLLQSATARQWLELLWISRAGLKIDDLEALTEAQPVDLDPQAPGLLYGERRLALATSRSRDAVARRWLGDHGRRQKLHMRLAEHFGKQNRAESLELACWHWSAAGRLDRVEETLTDTKLLEGMAQPAHAFEAVRHWRALGGSQRMKDTLALACGIPDRPGAAILGAAHVLAVGTQEDAPVKWLEMAAERAEAEDDAPTLLRALQKRATHGNTPAAAARELLERAVALSERQSPVDREAQASLHHHLACALETDGLDTDARREYELGIECMEAVAGQESPRLIPWLNNLGAAHKAAGDLRAADEVSRRSLRLARQNLGPQHPTTAVCCDQLAGIAYMNGQYDSAEPLYREALEITESAFGPQHSATAACLGNYGTVLDAGRKFREAEQSYRRSLSILMACHGETHEDTASCMHNLAVVLESLGNTAEAERLYRKALETWNEVAGEKSPAFATTLLNLAGVLRERGAWGEAEALYRSDIEIWRELLGADHPHTLGALTELARLYVDGGKPEMAEPLLLHLADRTRAHSGKSGTAYLEVAALLAGVQHRFGQSDDARALLRDALAASEGTLNMLSAPVQKLRKLLTQIDENAPETPH